MEEEETSIQEVIPEKGKKTAVGFPEIKKRKRNLKGIIFLLAFFLLPIFSIFWFKNFSTSKKEKTTFKAPTPTLTPTPTLEAPTLSKKDLRIQILNGTGIPNAAASLKTELERLGYENIKTANATSQNHTETKVSFSEKISQEIRDEIVKKLESIYEKTNEETLLSNLFDIIIITGSPKNLSSTPHKTTPTYSLSPTPSL